MASRGLFVTSETTAARCPGLNRHKVPIVLDCPAQLLPHRPIRTHIKQNATRVAQQAIRPICDHQRPDNSGQRVHPQPSINPSERQPRDSQYRYHGIGNDMYVSRADTVVTKRGTRWHLVSFESMLLK